MKKREILGIALLAIMLMGCARACQSFDKEFQMTKKGYRITQYSGGKIIGYWECHCMVNSSESSDGYYFRKGDTIIEISGDVRLEYIDD